MAYINIDLDEFDDDDIIDELKKRAKSVKMNIFDFIAEGIGESYKGGGTDFEKIVDILGLNILASKQDVINEINEKL